MWCKNGGEKGPSQSPAISWVRAWLQVVAERRKWARFGDAVKEQVGDSVTVQCPEEIPFERTRQSRQTQEEKKAQDLKTALAGSDNSQIVGRFAPAFPVFNNLRAGMWQKIWKHNAEAQGRTCRLLFQATIPVGGRLSRTNSSSSLRDLQNLRRDCPSGPPAGALAQTV